MQEAGTLDLEDRGANFGPERIHRYLLWRIWDRRRGVVLFIALNPSTADAKLDDPTVRRMMRFARDWGYGGIEVVNMFAFRATQPADLKRAVDPVGRNNNQVLLHRAHAAKLVVACWGRHGAWRGRDHEVRRLLKGIPVHHLGMTNGGHPRHPLYLRTDTQPQPWEEP